MRASLLPLPSTVPREDCACVRERYPCRPRTSRKGPRRSTGFGTSNTSSPHQEPAPDRENDRDSRGPRPIPLRLWCRSGGRRDVFRDDALREFRRDVRSPGTNRARAGCSPPTRVVSMEWPARKSDDELHVTALHRREHLEHGIDRGDTVRVNELLRAVDRPNERRDGRRVVLKGTNGTRSFAQRTATTGLRLRRPRTLRDPSASGTGIVSEPRTQSATSKAKAAGARDRRGRHEPRAVDRVSLRRRPCDRRA